MGAFVAQTQRPAACSVGAGPPVCGGAQRHHHQLPAPQKLPGALRVVGQHKSACVQCLPANAFCILEAPEQAAGALHPSCAQVSHGFSFVSDTDTEVIPKLCQYVYDSSPPDTPLSEASALRRASKRLWRWWQGRAGDLHKCQPNKCPLCAHNSSPNVMQVVGMQPFH